MSQVFNWFERKFEFTFPPELYPTLCVRLRGTPARLEELLRGSSRELLTKKPEGKWSAQEQAGHLLDLEPLWLARVSPSTMTITWRRYGKFEPASRTLRQAATLISGLVDGSTSPISTAGTPAAIRLRVSKGAASYDTEINNPPAVCGSKSSVLISSSILFS